MAVIESPNTLGTQVGPDHTYSLLLKEVLDKGDDWGRATVIDTSTHPMIMFLVSALSVLTLWRYFFFAPFASASLALS